MPAPPIRLAAIVLLIVLSAVLQSAASSTDDQIAALNAKKNDAVFKVEDIVNQPVTHLRRTPDMNDVGYYQDGWFDPGALTPDYDHVDIRATQELPYLGNKYVTSPANPGEVFLSSELEFNSMTKCFYTDRLLPKKKLTDAEMQEINQLYRIIGSCNDQLQLLENPEPMPAQIHQWIRAHKPVVAAVIGVLLVILIFIRQRRRSELQS